ncbi:helix-turn-helix domain-containing protein [Hymenobacter crusticola]|nr:helix-turn-helix domain-containing protein [Hymenobacter crusticola]
MSKGLLAEKIGALRKSKGLSQEQLADESSINLRTLQRIESGSTEPRGNTLRAIARVLDTPLEELLDFTQEANPGFLQLMNLASLSFWIVPLGNLFIPLILWVLKRDKVKGVDQLGRRMLNFQLTWCFIIYGFLFMVVLCLFKQLPFFISPLLIAPVVLSLCLVNTVIILVASFQLQRGREVVYSFAVPIL